MCAAWIRVVHALAGCVPHLCACVRACEQVLRAFGVRPKAYVRPSVGTIVREAECTELPTGFRPPSQSFLFAVFSHLLDDS
jgi:hypothetical protein